MTVAPDTLSEPALFGREFGSALLATKQFAKWLASQDLELPTGSEVLAYRWVQVEALLAAIERAAQQAAQGLAGPGFEQVRLDEERQLLTLAAKARADGHADTAMRELRDAYGRITAARHARDPRQALAAELPLPPELPQNSIDEVPQWRVGADAQSKWRDLIRGAIRAGDLQLLEFGSKLPQKRAAPINDVAAPEPRDWKNHPKNEPWPEAMKAELLKLREEGWSLKRLAAHFGRTNTAIRNQLEAPGSVATTKTKKTKTKSASWWPK